MTVPAGTLLAVPVTAVHQDESIYANAGEFDGFRFYNLRNKYGDQPKYHWVNTNSDYLIFGGGEHQWYLYFSRQLKIQSRQVFCRKYDQNYGRVYFAQV